MRFPDLTHPDIAENGSSCAAEPPALNLLSQLLRRLEARQCWSVQSIMGAMENLVSNILLLLAFLRSVRPIIVAAT